MHLRGKLRAVMTVRQRRDAGGQAMDLSKTCPPPLCSHRYRSAARPHDSDLKSGYKLQNTSVSLVVESTGRTCGTVGTFCYSAPVP